MFLLAKVPILPRIGSQLHWIWILFENVVPITGRNNTSTIQIKSHFDGLFTGVSDIILSGVRNVLTADTHKIIFWPVGSGEGTLRIIRSIEPGAAETPAAGKRSLVSSFASFLPTYKSKTSAAAKISKTDTTDELCEAMLIVLTIDNNDSCFWPVSRSLGWFLFQLFW